MMRSSKVLLVDDNDGLLEALGAWLEAEIAGVRVVARARCLREAEQQASKYSPDLIVSSAVLPDGNGFELARRLDAIAPGATFLFLTSYGGHGLEAGGPAAGAHACVAKMAILEELLPAVRSVLSARHRVGRR